MLKYLEKELNRTNEDIKYLSLEKEELENNIVEFEQIIDSIEQYIQLKKKKCQQKSKQVGYIQ